MSAPQHLQARAVAAFRAGELAEAERCYRELSSIYPHPGVLHNLGLVLVRLRRDSEAVPLFQRSLEARWDSNVALALSNALIHSDRAPEALAWCEQVLAVDPANRDARHNKSVALRELNRHGDAAALLEALLREDPADADAEFNLSLAELMLERHQTAWSHYEARWRGSDARNPLPASATPVWKPGESLAGRALLVQAEQGLGDTLQFLSLVPRLDAICARVDLQLQPELVALVSRCWPGRHIDVLGTQSDAPIEARIALMSVPLALETQRIDPIRAYVHADPARVETWRARLRAHAGPRVGIAWRGNPKKRHDPRRSVPLASLRPWMEAAARRHVAIVALQRDAAPDERAWLAQFAHVEAPGESLRDFDDTAAVMALCDHVVSVDSALIHLAGALGRPATVLLKFSSDWRWGVDRPDGATYESVRMIRQRAAGDWNGVVRSLIERLP
jgi:tetratricopeptide (TPR) repeat protein